MLKLTQSNFCILCGAKAPTGAPRCNDCERLREHIISLFEDAKEQLSNNPSVERETVFKILREFAFAIQEDSLLRTYKNATKFFLQQFIDSRNDELSLELFMKKVQTKLNLLKVLEEFTEGALVDWDARSINSETTPKILAGKVIVNLRNSYDKMPVPERSEQRYGHAITFYAILPLMIRYSQCNSKDEIKRLPVVPKKPWVILLSIIIGNSENKISLEKTSRFLKPRRGIGNIYGTIITNLSNLSPDYIQKATIKVEKNENNDTEYLISPDIAEYLTRMRENIRTRLT